MILSLPRLVEMLLKKAYFTITPKKEKSRTILSSLASIIKNK